MKQAILAICVLSFLCSCGAGRAVNNISNNEDSTLLCKKDSLSIGSTVQLVLPLAFLPGRNYDDQKHTWLLFDTPQIIMVPDGVYEIYLSADSPAGTTLSSTHPAFINVLDLYPLTGPDAKSFAAMDIGAAMKKLALQKKPFSLVYLTLLFRGNSLPGGAASAKAGTIRFTSLRIVQTKSG